MKATFSGKKISSILGILPQKEVMFEDEVSNYNFPEKQTMRLKRVMGFEKHRLADASSTVFDFAKCGMNYMFENNWISKDEIGAIVVVTLCPDYFVPHISNLLHGEFDLDEEVVCLDISQGCCGYLVGLYQSFSLLDNLGDKKVLLINGDVLSHKVSHKDRNDYPLIGDGTTISVIENSDEFGDIFYSLKTSGKEGKALIIPAGGFKMPSTPETAVMNETGDGNLRALDHMHMDGGAVFSFVQEKVPPMLADIMEYSNSSMDEMDYFLFHQPNKFMLQKLAQKAGIPFEKLPMNLVETTGNLSGACIPMITALNLSNEMKQGKYKCCLSAFGSGLTLGAIVMEMGNMNNCELIISEY